MAKLDELNKRKEDTLGRLSAHKQEGNPATPLQKDNPLRLADRSKKEGHGVTRKKRLTPTKHKVPMEDITKVEGEKAVEVALEWAKDPTPYAMVGPDSKKGKSADCSGSIARIFEESGLDFVPVNSSGITTSEYYRKLGPDEKPRAGDIYRWPPYKKKNKKGKLVSHPGHVVMYAPNITVLGITDYKGRAADALGAHGADITGYGNVPFGGVSLKNTKTHLKATIYRRMKKVTQTPLQQLSEQHK